MLASGARLTEAHLEARKRLAAAELEGDGEAADKARAALPRPVVVALKTMLFIPPAPDARSDAAADAAAAAPGAGAAGGAPPPARVNSVPSVHFVARVLHTVLDTSTAAVAPPGTGQSAGGRSVGGRPGSLTAGSSVGRRGSVTKGGSVSGASGGGGGGVGFTLPPAKPVPGCDGVPVSCGVLVWWAGQNRLQRHDLPTVSLGGPVWPTDEAAAYTAGVEKARAAAEAAAAAAAAAAAGKKPAKGAPAGAKGGAAKVEEAKDAKAAELGGACGSDAAPARVLCARLWLCVFGGNTLARPPQTWGRHRVPSGSCPLR